MKRVNVETYQDDKYYPRVVRAVQSILAKVDVVTPIDVFVHMDLLSKEDVESWRFGRIPYLEKVIHCSLGKTERILRILRMHVHDLNMIPSITAYMKWGKRKGPPIPLRFSKNGVPKLEEAYSRHFLRPGLNSKKKRSPAEPADSEGQPPELALRDDSSRTERGTFELVPATLVPHDQPWFHHPEMQARVTKSEEDFAAGRSTWTESPEQAQAFLDSLKKKSRH